ncbi:MAG: hypothetical protein DRR16_10860 [Candidatus Parabeggiatoa sp. nov. 3]|jgi:hypothetical protein|nr:MAG: hypothetical protein DRR00_09935 [Gammaproteobacteria bacterium]RKZ67721.1 MAG: hypothetical protein DRQ99_05850 [Gammaproteobacteria bacterium]RKZ85961.1 MAG: hypothetical protein DRR16_10860 [Gammaproteobacteria bacterium]HEW97503.1 hypothetical protein [Beggiatoa sp.]
MTKINTNTTHQTKKPTLNTADTLKKAQKGLSATTGTRAGGMPDWLKEKMNMCPVQETVV